MQICVETNTDVVALVEATSCLARVEPTVRASVDEIIAAALPSYLQSRQERVRQFVEWMRGIKEEEDQWAVEGPNGVELHTPAVSRSPLLAKRFREQVRLERKAKDLNRLLLSQLEQSMPADCFAELLARYWESAFEMAEPQWPRAPREQFVRAVLNDASLTPAQHHAIEEAVAGGLRSILAQVRTLADAADDYLIARTSGGLYSADVTDQRLSRMESAQSAVMKAEDALVATVWATLTPEQQSDITRPPSLYKSPARKDSE